MIHSGLQPSYGFPVYSCKQVQAPAPFCSRQTAFEPHGEGTQGDEKSCDWGPKIYVEEFISRTHYDLYYEILSIHLLSCTIQAIVGSPVYLGRQLHIGVWLITWHSAFMAQAPGQGSLHFWFMQAKCPGHSLLLTHSGRHEGGDPEKPGKHEQEGTFPLTWHWAFAPQGDGTHGLIGSGGDEGAINLWINDELNSFID